MVFQTDLWCVGYGCDGSSSKVDWVVAGTVTLGMGSTTVCSMETPAAMTVGTGDFENWAPCFTFKTAGDTWTFTIGGALTISALSYMTKVDGAPVDWEVSGAITFGAQSIAVSDMESIFYPNQAHKMTIK
jgi:hypothetical protein